MLTLAINGFGRIGKSFLRGILQDPLAHEKLKVRAINIGPASLEHVGLLFKYDTIMGQYPGTVKQEHDTLIIDDQEISLLAESDIKNVDWRTFNIDWVVDCSGQYTSAEKAQKHLEQGAKNVLISAPAKGDVVSIIPGVNDHAFEPKNHHIISLGSCTTNALMPSLKVLHEDIGFMHAYVTTMHAYTNSQTLLDADGKDPRRSRAAALNIVPTTTGAAKMISKIIPEIADKVTASAVRVPVGIVSLLQITATVDKKFTPEQLHKIFLDKATSTLKGIIDVSTEPLVSSDYIGNPFSIVIDSTLTYVVGNLITVCGWYDNEWAYSLRMKDFLLQLL